MSCSLALNAKETYHSRGRSNDFIVENIVLEEYRELFLIKRYALV